MKTVAIVGASGYSGEELIRLLLHHPQVELTAVTSRQSAGQTVAQVFPKFASHPRARTLRKVLVSYPEVRHIRPDCISLDATADARTIDTVVRFLERQQWLVTTVAVE